MLDTCSILKRQLDLFDTNEPLIIKQDNELLEFIGSEGIKSARLVGNTDHIVGLNLPAHDQSDIVVYLVNESFRFDQVVDTANNLLKNHLTSQGWLYLAVNKFLAEPDCYDQTLPVDYELAILKYLEKNINATLQHYITNHPDNGTYFNWVHPLTRFYFQKND